MKRLRSFVISPGNANNNPFTVSYTKNQTKFNTKSIIIHCQKRALVSISIRNIKKAELIRIALKKCQASVINTSIVEKIKVRTLDLEMYLLVQDIEGLNHLSKIELGLIKSPNVVL